MASLQTDQDTTQKVEPASFVKDRVITVDVKRTLGLVHDRFADMRAELLAERVQQRAERAAGHMERNAATADLRAAAWTVDPLPESLLDRRVELLGGTRRHELLAGLNSGARSYVADLWNLTGGDEPDILRGHRNVFRTVHGELAVITGERGRTRSRRDSNTRLILVPRPLAIGTPGTIINGSPIGATFLDVVVHCMLNAAVLMERQQAVLFMLRDVNGMREARFHAELFAFMEQHLGLPRGSVRATVMLDTVNGALECEEILYELRHHAYGLSLDPQAYAADHIALFTAADRPPMPDRETIGLNAPFLRSLSLLAIGTAHKRSAHAIGAPAFVLPPDDDGVMRTGYLEMLADKEREAVDGHDGTLVGHPGLVSAALTEFNKSVPMAHQMSYQRKEVISPADLVSKPEGTITVDSLVGMLRTTLRALAQVSPGEALVQGGRIHDRSSIQLALSLLWQWVHSRSGVITTSGLEVHDDLVRYLVKKESDKLMADPDPAFRTSGPNAGERLLHLVLAEEHPVHTLV